MKSIHCLIATLAALLIFVSCDKKSGDDSVTVKPPKIEITPSAPDRISGVGGETKINLIANREWSITGTPDWLTVSPMSGKSSLYKQEIKISAEKNEGGVREAVLTVKVDGLSKDINVVQGHSFGSNVPAEAIFYNDLQSSMGDFTINNVNLPSGVSKVWEFTSQYQCMKATAYVNGTNYASESWLVSPEIDLSGISACYFTFDHAGLYFGEFSKEGTVWVSKNGGDWEQLIITSENFPSSWNFVSAGEWDLSAYIGSKIKIGFKYYSTSTKAGTWEVRNAAILRGKSSMVNVGDVNPVETNWMELPATDNTNYKYFSHRFKMNDQVYRNYSFAWSQKDLVSVWVAYPLCKTYTTKFVDRQDSWAYDPHLGKGLSSAPFSNYAGDYARGHQLPSADRLCSKEANSQTFYGTNIAPQLNEHNEGIWANLENKVRSIANASDTTYVVTGCVVDGATEFSTDSDGNKITIPVAFFKALLRYQKGAANEWIAAGFYTDHKKYSNNSDFKAISMSIDELEKKLGIDFFVNLEKKVGKDAAAAIEAANPSNNTVLGL